MRFALLAFFIVLIAVLAMSGSILVAWLSIMAGLSQPLAAPQSFGLIALVTAVLMFGALISES